MFRRNFVIACLMLGFFLWKVEVSAQIWKIVDQRLSIKGTIVDNSQALKTIPSAMVKLYLADTLFGSRITDSLGQFSLSSWKLNFNLRQRAELRVSFSGATHDILTTLYDLVNSEQVVGLEPGNRYTTEKDSRIIVCPGRTVHTSKINVLDQEELYRMPRQEPVVKVFSEFKIVP